MTQKNNNKKIKVNYYRVKDNGMDEICTKCAEGIAYDDIIEFWEYGEGDYKKCSYCGIEEMGY
jgi:hypothetical protein